MTDYIKRDAAIRILKMYRGTSLDSSGILLCAATAIRQLPSLSDATVIDQETAEMALRVVERYVNETGAVINVTDRQETRHYFEFEGRETDD